MGSAAVQGHWWSRAAYDWAELQEPNTLPLWEAMLDAAMIGPGSRVLDAGCGAGGASVIAASRGALINGIDAASALLAIAHKRVPDGDFQVGDLEALPYANGIFAAILAADVLPYVTDPLAALRELRRVCLPGGRVVVAVRSRRATPEQHTVVAAMQALLPAPLGVTICTLDTPDALEALMTRAGLTVRGGGTIRCPSEYLDREMAVQAQLAAGPLQAILRLVGEQVLRAALQRVLAPYQTGTGTVRLCCRYRYVTAVAADEHSPSR